MNLEAVVAELLAHPLDEFTQRRNAKVKELKASGQSDLATQLSAIKKPSVPLWGVDRLAMRDRPMLDGLRSGAEAVVKAQAAAAAGRSNAARDLRAASEEFQRKLDAATSTAAAILRESGHSAAEETLRRMREILRLTAVQGGDGWNRLKTGALISEPQPGDDMLAVFGAGATPAAANQAERAEARRAAEQAERLARADAERAQRAAATAQRLRQEAAEMAAAAERAVARAKAAEDEAARVEAQAKKSQRPGKRPK